ncbi:hypothetical protein CPB84DRAFT_1838277 [Gymnopilus junonius]|uniref:Uncharacterized protein n=1 Tax=Gymnopilus junonius TaxID=109634 RepID=A0A9P5TIG9_GYMJU|nr:hypothetical protein CPB84DRAFT_1838277 [Gymnopilus junonius]
MPVTRAKLFYYYFTYQPPDYFKLSGVPSPTPLWKFDVSKAKPRPYRPFRWEYHQNMALKKLEPDWWIELESTYRERIAQRKQLFFDHGKGTLTQLMEMVIQYLCTRYPNQFRIDWASGVFQNRILKTSFDTGTINPLHFLLENVPEDFLITEEDKSTGLYVLRAAVSCSAVGWRLAEKMGRPLHEVHGPVPDYEEKMKFSMDRFFTKMTCDKPIQRGSWSLEIGQLLYSQPGDSHYKLREIQSSEIEVEDIYLRVDWQTLRRLPRSKAIKSYLEYKSTHHVEHKLLPALDLWAKEQEDRGWVPKDWKERTLDEDPFYPAWNKIQN